MRLLLESKACKVGCERKAVRFLYSGEIVR